MPNLNFLSGSKTYITAAAGIVLTWLGVFLGVDLICAVQSPVGVTDPSCGTPPDLKTAAMVTWAGATFIFQRMGSKKAEAKTQ